MSLHSRRTWHGAGAKGIDKEDVFEERSAAEDFLSRSLIQDRISLFFFFGDGHHR